MTSASEDAPWESEESILSDSESEAGARPFRDRLLWPGWRDGDFNKPRTRLPLPPLTPVVVPPDTAVVGPG